MIEVLGNWGEFIGGIAVVASLVYVGLQVRASVRQGRVDSYTKMAELWSQWTLAIASDKETGRIYLQGTQDFQSLDEIEQVRFNMLLAMYFGIVDTVMAHEKERFYEYPESYRRTLDQAFETFSLPGVQEWWAAMGNKYMYPHVVEYLESRKRGDSDLAGTSDHQSNRN